MSKKRITLTALATLVFTGYAGAQTEAEQIEALLATTAIDVLDKFAMKCHRQKCPARGRVAWLEIVHEYSPDHERTRKSLGHLRAGTVWHPPKNRKLVPDEETPRARKSLEKAWLTACKTLGAHHRRAAQQLAKAGDAQRAEKHYRRALRFLPGDAVSGKALGLTEFDGLWLTPLQLQVERRARVSRRP